MTSSSAWVKRPDRILHLIGIGPAYRDRPQAQPLLADGDQRGEGDDAASLMPDQRGIDLGLRDAAVGQAGDIRHGHDSGGERVQVAFRRAAITSIGARPRTTSIISRAASRDVGAIRMATSP